MKSIQEIVSGFVEALKVAIQAENQKAIMAAIGGTSASHVQAPPKAGPAKKRRKGPIQLCPVPGCAGRAAPIFSMVCSKHKGLSKATIKKYREARRAKAKAKK